MTYPRLPIKILVTWIQHFFFSWVLVCTSAETKVITISIGIAIQKIILSPFPHGFLQKINDTIQLDIYFVTYR